MWIYGPIRDRESACPHCGQIVEGGSTAFTRFGTNGEEGAVCDIHCLIEHHRETGAGRRLAITVSGKVVERAA